ncbi:MAG: hypothetical protein IJS54_05585 [Desulfovibrio sp.]|nr:hypothetical protein [Desulfovibrio sp.]
MKHSVLFVLVLCVFLLASAVSKASPYGPTLNDVVDNYAATRNFDMLKDSLSKELINIRLGMKKEEVQQWAAKSRVYELTSRKNSIYRFDPKDFDVSRLSFEVWFAKGEVVTIKTFNVNNFESEENDLQELKALRPVRVNECWVSQNYVDVHSRTNGFDFVLMTERGIPANEDDGCMGSDRANITIGRPGLLYPKHVQ